MHLWLRAHHVFSKSVLHEDELQKKKTNPAFSGRVSYGLITESTMYVPMARPAGTWGGRTTWLLLSIWTEYKAELILLTWAALLQGTKFSSQHFWTRTADPQLPVLSCPTDPMQPGPSPAPRSAVPAHLQPEQIEHRCSAMPDVCCFREFNKSIRGSWEREDPLKVCGKNNANGLTVWSVSQENC